MEDDSSCEDAGVCLRANDAGVFCFGDQHCESTGSHMLGCTHQAQGSACCESLIGSVILNPEYCHNPEESGACGYFFRDATNGEWNVVGSLLLSDLVLESDYTGSVILTTSAVDGLGQGGALELFATRTIRIGLGSSITMAGRGWGGGGGGGGSQFGSSMPCQPGAGGGTGHDQLDGQEGTSPEGFLICNAAGENAQGGAGGKGGGLGGNPGQAGLALVADSAVCTPSGNGSGGKGGGPFGGRGGALHGVGNVCGILLGIDCTMDPEAAEDGTPGGYGAVAANGDTSTDESIARGSGGGGGAGGAASSVKCCGGASGGRGGVLGGAGTGGCVGGSGGGGGAAGGGSILLHASTIIVDGEINASGAGHATQGGGHGAGGGILLKGRKKVRLGSTARITSLGGADDGLGTEVNGGTVKLVAPEVEHVPGATISAGRIHPVTW